MTETQGKPRSPEEIDALKHSWREDPHWDLEETEGFEAHRDELHAYRLACEERWRAERDDRLAELASTLGVPGNLALAARVQSIENRLARLENP